MVNTEKRQFISIAEYAKLKNISLQTVKEALNTTLKPYYVEVDGTRNISISALSKDEIEYLFGQEETSKPTNETKKAELDVFQQTLTLLQAQIEAKDRIIENLQKQNAEKDRHLLTQSAELTRLLAQSQELQRNNQILLAKATEQHNKEEAETILAKPNTTPQEAETVPIVEQMEEEIREQGKHKGLLSRLFKR